MMEIARIVSKGLLMHLDRESEEEVVGLQGPGLWERGDLGHSQARAQRMHLLVVDTSMEYWGGS
jgi:hypothetical protein